MLDGSICTYYYTCSREEIMLIIVLNPIFELSTKYKGVKLMKALCIQFEDK